MAADGYAYACLQPPHVVHLLQGTWVLGPCGGRMTELLPGLSGRLLAPMGPCGCRTTELLPGSSGAR